MIWNDTTAPSESNALNQQGRASADHFVVHVGYTPEGEDHFEPIALYDGLYESETYAQNPDVIAQIVADLTNSLHDLDPRLGELNGALRDGTIRYRVGAVRFVSEGTP